MNHNYKPTVSKPVLRAVLIFLFIEASAVYCWWNFRGLCQAVSQAASRYEGGPERLATYQQEEQP